MKLRTIAPGLLVTILGCKQASEPSRPSPTVTPSAPVAASSSAVTATPSPPTSAPRIPVVACETSRTVAWVTNPSGAFSCSPMRTSELSPGTSTSHTDESGAEVTPIDLTLAPGSRLVFSVAVRDDKGAATPAGKTRYEVKGLSAAKVDASTQELRWTVAGSPGDTLRFSVAALVTRPEGERCVQQAVVVRVRDDDATRANQVAAKVRMEQFYRKLSCMWAHQGGSDPAENAHADLEDEKSLRRTLACGGTFVSVRMQDVDGDGLRDAVVRFAGRPRLGAKPGEAALESGFGVQVHLRKGDDFVRRYEAPGDLFEAADGSLLFLDPAEVENMNCPPRPYMSTGMKHCAFGTLDVFRVIGGKVEQTNAIVGEPSPGFEPGSMDCPRQPLVVRKDAKGRVLGIEKAGTLIPWDAKGVVP